MTNYIFWDKKSDLYPPSGKKKTPQEIFDQFGWAENPNIYVVIGMNGQVMGSFDNLDILKSVYNIETEDPDEALQQINEKANAPQEEPGPSPEERIAAALEFQNLLSL